MGMHATYARDYISKCVKYLEEFGADNVGGVMVTLPRDDTLVGKAIAQALSHKFGVGNSTFRAGLKNRSSSIRYLEDAIKKRSSVKSDCSMKNSTNTRTWSSTAG